MLGDLVAVHEHKLPASTREPATTRRCVRPRKRSRISPNWTPSGPSSRQERSGGDCGDAGQDEPHGPQPPRREDRQGVHGPWRARRSTGSCRRRTRPEGRQSTRGADDAGWTVRSRETCCSGPMGA